MTLIALALALLLAQEPPVAAVSGGPGLQEAGAYVLGPGDKLDVFVLDLPELQSREVAVDLRGFITLPTAGRIQAAGLTAAELEARIEDRLRRILVEPDAAVSVTEMRSQPISVLGSVNKPGIHQLEGRKTLFEVLSLAGGLADTAGYKINITRKLSRGPLPLANAVIDESGQYSIGSVRVEDIMLAAKPSENILVLPEDTISVPKGSIIYALGSVNRPGGYVLGEKDSLTVIELLANAQGWTQTAKQSKAVVLRTVPDSTNREEIPVNLSRIIDGKDDNLALQPDDILVVPNSTMKSLGLSALNTLAGQAGWAVYRIGY